MYNTGDGIRTSNISLVKLIMDLHTFRKKIEIPSKQATLCFLIKEDRVLLGMKKRGFAEGKWNGFGGKVNEGENILDAVIREVQEETLVTPIKLNKLAVLDFFFVHKPEWSQRVFTYTTSLWDGEPTETEEMRPEWFDLNKLPYQNMWVDDIHWLPQVLEGKCVKGAFLFDEEENILDHKVSVLKSLND